MSAPFVGLVAATHTPMAADGGLALDGVERIAEHLARQGVRAVFIGGTTGESHSLAVEERTALALRWAQVGRVHAQRVIVHVGHNSVTEAEHLARHAGRLTIDAIACSAPSFFKPGDESDLVRFCAPVAAAAPELPFYFYDLPELTGVRLSMTRFLAEAREAIPTLRGIKYTRDDLIEYQRLLELAGDSVDVLYGRDETLLAGLALGARGAVGSTYNFAAALYHRILAAFREGRIDDARADQRRSVRMIDVLDGYGYMGAAKCAMRLVGVDCGPVRRPLRALDDAQVAALHRDLEELGFFEWIR